jgi:hypothetical protein
MLFMFQIPVFYRFSTNKQKRKMPSAPRIRMPHNNRMHSSAALKMTGIWKDTIGYDPYAAEV